MDFLGRIVSCRRWSDKQYETRIEFSQDAEATGTLTMKTPQALPVGKMVRLVIEE